MRKSLLVIVLLAGCGGGNRTTPAPMAMEGMVSINFDDGFESAWANGLPIMDKAGFKTTQFIITQKLNVPNYISDSQMLTMQANGHEIAAHTRTHPHLSTLTGVQQHDEIEGSVSDLAGYGITPKVFAYPYGDYDDLTISIVKANGFRGARTIHSGFNDANSQALLLECLLINEAGVSDSNWINQKIDETQANGTWLVLVFHRVDETGNPISISHDIIQQAVDHLLEKKTRVVTMSEGLNLYNLKP